MENKLVLIDGNSIINRAFYGVPDLTNKEGLHTNAIYGFLNIMFKILEEEKPSHILVAFDKKAPTFRHKMYEQYKGTRKPMPEELREQVPILKDVLQAMNIMIYAEEGIEADDILGTMARKGEKEGFSVSVVSGDRDLLQLATDTIKVRIPKTKGGKTLVEDYHTAQVIEKYGVTPLQIIDLKGLMGDASDNIPGVPGVGEKTAVKILTVFGTVENALAHVEEITPNRAREAVKNNAELAKLSKTLATIKTDCRLGISMGQCRLENMYNEKAYRLIQSLDIKSILNRFGGDAGSDKGLEKNFQTLTSFSQWEEFLSRLPEKAPIGIYTVFRRLEDMSLDHTGQMTLFMSEAAGRLLGIAVAADKDNICFCKIGEKLPENIVIERLGELMEKSHLLVANDFKGQLDFFPKATPENSFDTNVAAYLIQPIQKSFAEEDIAGAYAGITMSPYNQLFGKEIPEAAYAEKEEEMIRYSCYCALTNVLSYPTLKKELKKIKSLSLFEEMEMPLVFTLYDMEKWGISVKRQSLKEYGSHLGSRIEELEKEIYERAGEEFNINSPKQLGVILFEKMRMPYGKKTKTGYSTSAEVLEKLRFEDPIIEMILEYRQLAKLKSTYADGLEGFIDKKDGRIHTTFNQNITATGRLSSTEPNLQNIPIRMELGRQIRKVFVPEEGYVFLDADYSQIELRVLAHMSGDERLIEAYKGNADIHRTTAALVFHTPYDEVTDLQRRNAKAVNFGIVYGISGFGLSRDLNITKKEAEQYIEDYFNTYPGVKEFMDKLVEDGKEKGYVTSLFGRRRPIPELQAKNFMQRQFGERIAMNSPIQGTAADIIKIAMIRVNNRLKEGNFRSRLILQIHDELLIETHHEEISEVTKILEEEMVHACDLSVPLIAEVKQGHNWYEAK
ncbi:MAG: DNA polymerase I [Lachnospiraceae bacterium]|nr:DNA polymerase I [Lachnospiraceae bacterium]